MRTIHEFVRQFAVHRRPDCHVARYLSPLAQMPGNAVPHCGSGDFAAANDESVADAGFTTTGDTTADYHQPDWRRRSFPPILPRRYDVALPNADSEQSPVK